jgi:ubiquinone/menaquinone biosynthesis C-methylase UbiE
MNKQKLYPDSGVELNPFIAKYYDAVMNFATLGFYSSFISKAVKNMGIKPDDAILDLGCGSGRNAKLMALYLGSNGSITGLDISEDMQTSFLSKFNSDHLAEFVNQRIDIDFDLNCKYDIVFISFVIHGFPHEVRKTIIRNAYKHLKTGGRFIILDFAEFNMDEMPRFHRWIFKKN